MRPARRLIFAVVWLVVFDQFVPDVQHRVERHRYEGARAFLPVLGLTLAAFVAMIV